MNLFLLIVWFPLGLAVTEKKSFARRAHRSFVLDVTAKEKRWP